MRSPRHPACPSITLPQACCSQALTLYWLDAERSRVNDSREEHTRKGVSSSPIPSHFPPALKKNHRSDRPYKVRAGCAQGIGVGKRVAGTGWRRGTFCPGVCGRRLLRFCLPNPARELGTGGGTRPKSPGAVGSSRAGIPSWRGPKTAVPLFSRGVLSISKARTSQKVVEEEKGDPPSPEPRTGTRRLYGDPSTDAQARGDTS